MAQFLIVFITQVMQDDVVTIIVVLISVIDIIILTIIIAFTGFS